MSQTTIATTDSPETGRGKINANFTEVYDANNTLPSQTNNSGKFLTTNGTAVSWASTTDTRIITLSFYKANPNDGDFLELVGISGVTDYKTRSAYTYARINGGFSGGLVYSAFSTVSGLNNGFTFAIRATVNSGGGNDVNTLDFIEVSGPTTVFSTSTLSSAAAQTYAWCTVELY